jgi:hypothetical protein
VCFKPAVGFAWGHSPHEYLDDIPWNSVPLRGFRGATLVAKY